MIIGEALLHRIAHTAKVISDETFKKTVLHNAETTLRNLQKLLRRKTLLRVVVLPCIPPIREESEMKNTIQLVNQYASTVYLRIEAAR